MRIDFPVFEDKADEAYHRQHRRTNTVVDDWVGCAKVSEDLGSECRCAWDVEIDEPVKMVRTDRFMLR